MSSKRKNETISTSRVSKQKIAKKSECPCCQDIQSAADVPVPKNPTSEKISSNVSKMTLLFDINDDKTKNIKPIKLEYQKPYVRIINTCILVKNKKTSPTSALKNKYSRLLPDHMVCSYELRNDLYFKIEFIKIKDKEQIQGLDEVTDVEENDELISIHLSLIQIQCLQSGGSLFIRKGIFSRDVKLSQILNVGEINAVGANKVHSEPSFNLKSNEKHSTSDTRNRKMQSTNLDHLPGPSHQIFPSQRSVCKNPIENRIVPCYSSTPLLIQKVRDSSLLIEKMKNEQIAENEYTTEDVSTDKDVIILSENYSIGSNPPRKWVQKVLKITKTTTVTTTAEVSPSLNLDDTT